MRPRHLHAFTLIELLIAVTLGIVLVYTATAAFRVAAQATTTANRLSLENAVLRAGYQIAHRDLDFWTNVDDPAIGRIGLRAGGNASGMPFTPFATSWPGAGVSDAESATAYDPRDTAWSMGNPRVWWRGNMAEKNNTDLRFGRYSLFANRSTSLAPDKLATVRSQTGVDGAGAAIFTNFTYGGPVQVPHSWHYAQISALEKSLGFYGLCDYLPANAVYAYYVPWDGNCNLGGLPKWLVDPGGSFNNGDGGQQTPRGKYRNSYQTSYGIIDPRSTNDANELRNRHRRHYHLGYNSNLDPTTGESPQDGFNRISAIPDDHLASRPQNWPGLNVSVQRFIKNTRFVNLARVSWTNPYTGQTSELSFTGFGTTLRGARQQRNPDGTWAKWDNDGSTNSRTLDSP
jgi:hypothetical protein